MPLSEKPSSIRKIFDEATKKRRQLLSKSKQETKTLTNTKKIKKNKNFNNSSNFNNFNTFPNISHNSNNLKQKTASPKNNGWVFEGDWDHVKSDGEIINNSNNEHFFQLSSSSKHQHKAEELSLRDYLEDYDDYDRIEGDEILQKKEEVEEDDDGNEIYDKKDESAERDWYKFLQVLFKFIYFMRKNRS